jgi:hypothetical protein
VQCTGVHPVYLIVYRSKTVRQSFYFLACRYFSTLVRSGGLKEKKLKKKLCFRLYLNYFTVADQMVCEEVVLKDI